MPRPAAFLYLLLALGGCGATPSSETPTQQVAEGERYAFSAIVFLHVGVETASDTVTRSLDEAKAEAAALAQTLQADPGGFADAARRVSEGAEAESGGYLGSFDLATVREHHPAVLDLEVGEVSDPVAREVGVVLYKREPLVEATDLSARRLVVAWKGANRAPAGVTRSKEEALARARELVAQARSAPEGFEALVRAESDGYDKGRGGYLGTWTPETERVPLGYDLTVGRLDIGGISEPYASTFGYEIFQRLEPKPLPPLFAGRHIVIGYAGAEGSTATRTRAQAQARAEELLALAKKEPETFARLAVEYSEHASGKDGGDLGTWRKGSTMPDALDQAIESLAFEGVGGPVETKLGFHVLQRIESPEERSERYRNPVRDQAPDEADGHDH